VAFILGNEPGGSNGNEDIFLRDRSAQITERVSIRTDGTQGNANSDYPALTYGGRSVLFSSAANNLVDGDNNLTLDVFLRDRMTGQTTRISLDTGGGDPNNWSQAPTVSADGRYVAYESRATDLIANDTNNEWDVLLRDREEGEFYTVSGNVSDLSTGGPLPGVTISAGGSYTAITDASGNYTLANLPAGSYSLVASLADYKFTPGMRTVSVPPNVTGQDFAGSAAELSLNHSSGDPGSWFTATGVKYPHNTNVVVSINGYPLGVVNSDAEGDVTFILNSEGAAEGHYLVYATAGDISVATYLVIAETDADPWPKEGEGTEFKIPAGIGFTTRPTWCLYEDGRVD
jgi:hypothetical protein